MRLNQLTVRGLINVIVLGLALCDDGETKKKGETKPRFKVTPRLG